MFRVSLFAVQPSTIVSRTITSTRSSEGSPSSIPLVSLLRPIPPPQYHHLRFPEPMRTLHTRQHMPQCLYMAVPLLI